VSTLQPDPSSSFSLLRSRSTLRESFSHQKLLFDDGSLALPHPSCLCQKHPCTKIAARRFVSTMSGRPGISAAWSLNL
jgi:hypothetical protein